MRKHLTKIACYIGIFHMVNYNPMLEKYAYHRMILCLLGEHECNDLRREFFWLEIIMLWKKVIILKY